MNGNKIDDYISLRISRMVLNSHDLMLWINEGVAYLTQVRMLQYDD